jgi:peptidoglycan/xylan/chitin deacetylase (PgdA/CDA1 family)
VLDDVAAGVEALVAAGAPAPRFFRPPYGQLSAASLVAARRQRMEVVLWSRWGREFTRPPAGDVARHLAAGLRPGAIALLHDSDAYAPAGTAALTHAVLPSIAEVLSERALGAVRLGELAGESS